MNINGIILNQMDIWLKMNGLEDTGLVVAGLGLIMLQWIGIVIVMDGGYRILQVGIQEINGKKLTEFGDILMVQDIW